MGGSFPVAFTRTPVSRRQVLRFVLLGILLLALALPLRPRTEVSTHKAGSQQLVRRPSHLEQLDRLFRGRTSPDTPTLPAASTEAWVNLTSSPWTTYNGGIEGYTVWSDLYLSGGVLVAAAPTQEEARRFADPRGILSTPSPVDGVLVPAGPDKWSTTAGADQLKVELGEKAIRLPGVTYLFNDQPGVAGFIAIHIHFLSELLIPAARVVATVRAALGLPDAMPSRVMFPRCGEEPSWRDDTGLNSWVLSNMLPTTAIEDRMAWTDRARGDTTYVFEQVIIVDRGAAHTAPGEVPKWNMMHAQVPYLPAPANFWDPFAAAMQMAAGNAMGVGRYGLPVVVFLERDSLPHISTRSSTAIVDGLRRLTARAEVHVVRIESMTRWQKVALLSRANIVIGLHSGDLLGLAWMRRRKGNAVVELFEAQGFERNFGILAESLNIKHVAIQGDRELTPAMWTDHQPGQRGEERDGEVDIDAGVVVGVVERLLDEVEGPQLVDSVQ